MLYTDRRRKKLVVLPSPEVYVPESETGYTVESDAELVRCGARPMRSSSDAELVLTAFMFATATNKRDYQLLNFPKDVVHKVIKDVEQAKLPLGQGLVQKSILAFNRAATVPTRSSREGVQGPKGMDPNHHKAAIAEHAMGVHKLLTKTGTGNLAAFQPNLRTNLGKRGAATEHAWRGRER